MKMVEPNKFYCVQLTQAEFEEWDHFVDKCGNSSIFCKSDLLKPFAKNLAIWVVKNSKSDAIMAGLCLDELTYLGFKACVMVKGMPYSPFLIKDLNQNFYNKNAFHKELLEILAKGMQRHYSYISFFLNPGLIDIHPFIWNGYVPKLKYTYIVDLDMPKAELSKKQKQRLRNAVKQKNDCELELSTDVEILGKLIEASYNKQGRNFDRKIVERMYEAVNKFDADYSGNIFLLKSDNGDYEYGVFILKDQMCYTAIFMGSRHGKSNYPDHAIIKLLDTLQNIDGPKTFDFEGSSRREIELFYSKFGGCKMPVFGVTFSSRLVSILVFLRKLLS